MNKLFSEPRLTTFNILTLRIDVMFMTWICLNGVEKHLMNKVSTYLELSHKRFDGSDRCSPPLRFHPVMKRKQYILDIVHSNLRKTAKFDIPCIVYDVTNRDF